MFKAHINGDKIQSCNEHSVNTALYTSNNLSSVGLEKTGYLIGLIHDAGKYTEEFNAYLEKAASGEKVAKGSVIHTFASVRMILSEFHSLYSGKMQAGKWNNLTAELVSIAAASHHWLFDVFSADSESGLNHRITTQPAYDKKAIDNFYSECADKKQIKELFQQSAEEIEKFTEKFADIARNDEEMLFYLGLIERLLESSVIDGDRHDTALFMSEYNTAFKTYSNDELYELWNHSMINLMNRLDSLENTTVLDCARREMSDCCESFAENICGIYRLNLPTGAGKTLSGLRYALKHAQMYHKKRIVFVTPLLSILEQNADVIKEVIGNDNVILEHHSDVVLDDFALEEFQLRESFVETWNSPIIITTLVQLLNTMFCGKTSTIRRFHSLVDSVVVIDEVQSVPAKMISLFNMALNFLSSTCNTTFLLCSATQPLMELNNHKLIINDAKAVPQHKMEEYKKIFKRNSAAYEGLVDEQQIEKMAVAYLHKYGSVLIICNTKNEAKDIYQRIKKQSAACYHLSTSMCVEHRRNALKEIINKLGKREKLICVSTQLIEAGVDASFGAVIRIAAGIDNIVQAAGRCNRNGESSSEAPVSIVSLTSENLSKLKDIKLGQDVTGALICEYQKNPKAFENDILSEESINYYYSCWFNAVTKIKHYTEFCTDGINLFDLLSCNQVYTPEDESEITMRQAFKTAGEKFKVFDDNQNTVIVPYGEGAEIINKILSDQFRLDEKFKKEVLKTAKKYSVNLFQYQVEELRKNKGIYTDEGNTVMLLNPDCYDQDTGVIFKEEEKEWNILIL